ncbi:hypothetical protein HDU92_004106 [Lobulomyces angularis]|nr:hypothetical protein HDU92_004106 [Lobulomyces angularis]
MRSVLSIFVFFCIVTSEVQNFSLSDINFALGPINAEKLKFPNKLQKPLEVSQAERLKIKFSVESETLKEKLNPQQVFLSLEAEKKNSHGKLTLVFQREEKKKGDYSLIIDLKSKNFVEALEGEAGNYLATIFISEPNYSPLSYSLGTFIFKFGEVPNINRPASESEEFRYKEEIRHIFKPPVKVPFRLISLIFAVLCVLPWVILFALWSSLAVNFNNLYATKEMVLYGTGFMISLGGWVALYIAYFWSVTLFPALACASVLSVFSLFFGNRVLVSKVQFSKLKTQKVD